MRAEGSASQTIIPPLHLGSSFAYIFKISTRTSMLFSSIVALSLAGGVLSVPAPMSARDDWKTALGWNGKMTTPAQLDPSNVVKPTPNTPAPTALTGGVYFCTEIDFKDTCLFVSGFNANQCVNFGKEFSDQVSSFGPDPGLACMLWSDNDCKGTNPGGFFVNPGSTDLRKQNFNDVASSFVCKTA